MKHHPVQGSSNIESIAHDPTTDTMEVEFKSGARYKYSGVPKGEFDRLLKTADDPNQSTGKLLRSDFIGKYPHRRSS